MQQLVKIYTCFIYYLNKLIGWTVALLLAIMSLLIFWQVFSRTLVGTSLTWSEELSRFIMIWIVLLGSCVALLKNEHIVVNVLANYVSEKTKKSIDIFIYLISIVFFIVLVIYGWDLGQASVSQKAPSTGISMFWAYLSIPVGAVLLILNSISLILERLFYIQKSVGEEK